MSGQSHLVLNEVKLLPSDEWQAARECWCFVRVCQGQGYWISASEVFELETGEVLVLAPLREGALRASQLGEVVLRFFLFCPDLLSGLLTLRELQQLQVIQARRKTGFKRFAPNTAVGEAFARLDVISEKSSGLLKRCQMLHVAATVFAREWRKSKPADKMFLTANKRIELLIQQLTEAELLNCSVAELADRCNCSPRHFKRLFMRNLGVSFRVKQAELRLQRARQILVETDDKVAMVAMEVGYRNPGLFNAMFKKQYGMSPSQWRQEARQPSPAISLLCPPPAKPKDDRPGLGKS